MATVFDVAEYMRQKGESKLDPLKLQKLLYFAQAWSMAWDGRPLFGAKIEAWTNGPVVRELWAAEKYEHDRDADPGRLTASERETVDEVLRFYGRKSGAWLVELSHREQPWLDARRGLGAEKPSRNAISHESLASYFSPQVQRMGRKRLTDALMRGLELIVSVPEDELPMMFEPSDVSVDDEIAYLEGRGPNPWASAY